jgi:hypothetical protein
MVSGRTALVSHQGSVGDRLCQAPGGVPEFLLDLIESPSSWRDELCSLLSVADDDIENDLQSAFKQRVPPGVQACFDDTRDGLAIVIGQLDAYVSSILDPAWLRASMALSTEVTHVGQVMGIALGTGRGRWSTTLMPTVFGVTLETFSWSGRQLMSVPIDQPARVLNRNRTPRAPLASLLGQPRSTILYALSSEVTVRDLVTATGQRHDSIVRSLELLCGTGLIAAEDAAAGRPATYRRTRLSEALLDAGASRGPTTRLQIVGISPEDS